MVFGHQKIVHRHDICFLLARLFFIIFAIVWLVYFFDLNPKIILDSNGILYVINNGTNETIKDIKIKYNDGECTLDLIPESSNRYLLVNYYGQLRKQSLSFFDKNNIEHIAYIDAKIGSNFSNKGTFNIFINKNYKVTVK